MSLYVQLCVCLCGNDALLMLLLTAFILDYLSVLLAYFQDP